MALAATPLVALADRGVYGRSISLCGSRAQRAIASGHSAKVRRGVALTLTAAWRLCGLDVATDLAHGALVHSLSASVLVARLDVAASFASVDLVALELAQQGGRTNGPSF